MNVLVPLVITVAAEGFWKKSEAYIMNHRDTRLSPKKQAGEGVGVLFRWQMPWCYMSGLSLKASGCSRVLCGSVTLKHVTELSGLGRIGRSILAICLACVLSRPIASITNRASNRTVEMSRTIPWDNCINAAASVPLITAQLSPSSHHPFNSGR